MISADTCILAVATIDIAAGSPPRSGSDVG